MDLSGKIALVTGGAQGIGQTIGEELVHHGALVVLGDINEEGVKNTADSMSQNGGSASGVRLDVTRPEEVQRVFKQIIEKHGRIDILVNNAGITRDGLLMRMKEEDWDLVLSVNLKGSFLCTQLAVKQMMKQKSGAIVNIASIVGLIGNFGQANYSASKAGLIALTKTAAREVGSRGVRVNAIAPGFIDTEMTRCLDQNVKEKLIEQIPMARLGQPGDIADCVVFLVSDRAKYITGQVISVNGGMLM